MLRFDVSQLLEAVVTAAPQPLELVFAVGRPPMVRLDEGLQPAHIPGLERLTPFHSEMVVLHLLAAAPHAAPLVRERGSACFTYSVPGKSRFLVSVFQQRGTFASVVRAIPERPPRLEELELRRPLATIASVRSGLVLINGPAVSGRSVTIAALVEEINHSRACHVVTVEAPIEYLYTHDKAVVNQREVGQDTTCVREGLEDVRRQGADVVVVSTVPDAASAALLLDVVEAGNLAIASLHALDTGAALRRFVDLFDPEDRASVPGRLARALVLSFTQRLLPRKGGGRVLAAELWRSLPSTREQLARGELASEPIAAVLREEVSSDVFPFDLSLEWLVKDGALDRERALAEVMDPRWLAQRLADVED